MSSCPAEHASAVARPIAAESDVSRNKLSANAALVAWEQRRACSPLRLLFPNLRVSQMCLDASVASGLVPGAFFYELIFGCGRGLVCKGKGTPLVLYLCTT